MTTALAVLPSPHLAPGRLSAPTPKAAPRAVEFFTAQINNDHDRRSDEISPDEVEKIKI
jgi:hypothetical protein